MFLPPGDKEAMEMRKRVKTMAYQIPTSKNMEPHPVINEPSIIKERIIKEQSQMPLLLTDNRSMEPPNIIPPPPSLFSPASSSSAIVSHKTKKSTALTTNRDITNKNGNDESASKSKYQS